QLGFALTNDTFFDTLTIATGERTAEIHVRSSSVANLRHVDAMHIGVSLDETTMRSDIALLWQLFAPRGVRLPDFDALEATVDDQGVSRSARRSASQRMPDSRLRAWHEPRIRAHGRHARYRRCLRWSGQRRSFRFEGEGGGTSQRARRDHGDVPVDAWRVRR